MDKMKMNMKSALRRIFSEERIIIISANIRFYAKSLIAIKNGLRGNILLKPQNGSKKCMPEVLQFPVTNKCNLLCKTCSVPEMKNKKDMDIEQLKYAIKDKIFEDIVSVGINGGEPFLLQNLEAYVGEVLTLPKIKGLNIISNGVLTERILERLKKIYKLCKKNNVNLGITFSLDGYKGIHDNIRGINGAFDKTVTTIQAIQKNMEEYCNNIGIICTVSKFNIYHLNELEVYAEINGLPNIDYQLAVPHKRLNNFDKSPDFSVCSDEYTKMLAMEFFYSLFIKTKLDNYYFIFKYLENNFKGRMVGCPWAEKAVTLDASGGLFYCAVNSDQIGSVNDESLYNKFFDYENIEYRKKLIKEKCDSCIHYNNSQVYTKSYIDVNHHMKIRNIWFYKYLMLGRRMK